jgi:hypothetical protein
MALHKDFPKSQHAILDPGIRWFPADEALRQWCEDINRVQSDVRYDFVYVDEESFERYKPSSFRQLLECFQEYKGEA